jgi:hypothetical protein
MSRLLAYALFALMICVHASYVNATRAADAPASATSNPQTKADAAVPAPAQTPGGETWRYRQHQGLWWYWLPSDKWVYWTDRKWVPYDAETYAKFNASRQPAVQTYSSRSYGSRDPYWGAWGPVYYNSYGQPQYPYSQRTSGMRQLGAVPTPAGVRSLPGWGGER